MSSAASAHHKLQLHAWRQGMLTLMWCLLWSIPAVQVEALQQLKEERAAEEEVRDW